MWITNIHSPIPTNFHPSEDVSNKRNTRGFQAYQELIGEIWWAVEIGCVDIFMEVALLYSHLAMPQLVHLKAVYQIFWYLKQVLKCKLYFDPMSPLISKDLFQNFEWGEFYQDAKKVIPDDMTQPKGKPMYTHCFEDVDHASDKVTRW